MLLFLLKSKIHRAQVTAANVNAPGIGRVTHNGLDAVVSGIAPEHGRHSERHRTYRVTHALLPTSAKLLTPLN